jgi:NADPH-dependent 2,4-dienoyl-CoA reductase/sulfur reductase-like enzyme
MAVAVTGESEKSLTRLGIPYRKTLTYSNSHAGYYPGGKSMFIKMLFAPDDGKILGAQITGMRRLTRESTCSRPRSAAA